MTVKFNSFSPIKKMGKVSDTKKKYSCDDNVTKKQVLNT